MWRTTVGVLAAVASLVGCGHDEAGPRESTAATSTVTTTTSAAPAIPAVSPAAAAVGFVDVRTAVPDALVDLRYATADNFVGTPLYPPDARCLVHESMVPGLRAAADALRSQGLTMVFWDCYRPHDVQVRMFAAVPNPNFVARPGPYSRSHETGRSVDVTFAAAQPDCPAERRIGALCLADMGTDFDDFSARARADAVDGVTPQARANRTTLRDAMGAGGLTVYSGEWWHFNGPDADVQRPIVNVPLN